MGAQAWIRCGGGLSREPRSPSGGTVALTARQVRSRQPRLVAALVAALMAVVVTGMLATGARAEPSAAQVNFSTTPTLSPKYGPFVRDYVVRCNDAPVDVSVHADTGWEVSVDNGPFQSGDFTQTVPLSSGQEFTVRIRDLLQTELYHYYVRCLPTDFPRYTYTRYAPASPQFFSVDPRPTPDTARYAIVFDNHGVPIW